MRVKDKRECLSGAERGERGRKRENERLTEKLWEERRRQRERKTKRRQMKESKIINEKQQMERGGEAILQIP